VVVSWETFHHIDAQGFYLYLEEFYRVLKDSGFVIINYISLSNQYDLDWFKKETKRHLSEKGVVSSMFKFHHPETIRVIAEDIGFDFKDIEDLNYPEDKIRHICFLKKPATH
jgi:cyclopropane fatty-acyl-phospholipid synthase-like methyltransferase